MKGAVVTISVGDLVRFKPDPAKRYIPPPELIFSVLRTQPVSAMPGGEREDGVLIQYQITPRDRFKSSPYWVPVSMVETIGARIAVVDAHS